MSSKVMPGLPAAVKAKLKKRKQDDGVSISDDSVSFTDYLKRFYPKPIPSTAPVESYVSISKYRYLPKCPEHGTDMHFKVKVRRSRKDKMYLVMGFECILCGSGHHYTNADMDEANMKASGDYE